MSKPSIILAACLAFLAASTSAHAQFAPPGAGCQITGGISLGSSGVCSEAWILSNGIPGAYPSNVVQTLSTDLVSVSGSGSYPDTGISGSASGRARTSIGRNGVAARSTSTVSDEGYPEFDAHGQGYSVWYDTFYIASGGQPYTINLNWSLDGQLSSAPGVTDNAVLQFWMDNLVQNVTGAELQITDLPSLLLSDDFVNDQVTPVGSAPFVTSGTATLQGTTDAAFVLRSTLWAGTDGNSFADFLSTAQLDFTVSSGIATMTDATGQLAFDGEAFVFASAAPIPEPETYVLMLAGLGLVGFAARRRRG